MAHTGLVICAITFAVLWVTNAVIMVTSPKLWFRLPSWTGVRGTMSEQRYGNTWGHVQVRALGAIFMAVIAWVIYDVLSN